MDNEIKRVKRENIERRENGVKQKDGVRESKVVESRK